MTSMKDKLIQAMEPTIAIKVFKLDKKPVKAILSEIHQAIKYKYDTMIDKETNTIYVGRRIQHGLYTGRCYTISQDFWLAKFEFTQAQWLGYMNKSIQEQRDLANPDWSLRGVGPHHPIYYVSWNECQELIAKLNRYYAKEIPSGYKIALPTEAQWEYACQMHSDILCCDFQLHLTQ